MANSFRDTFLLFQARIKKDPEAFGKLYDAYVNRIYRFIYFKVPSREEAEDIGTETFIRLWKYIQDGKPVAHVGALLYQIARNLVTDFYRLKPERLTALGEETAIGAADEERRSAEPSARDARLDALGELTAIERALRHLKDEYREVIIMRYLDELSPKEISTIIGKSPGATRVLIHRALESLRSVMGERRT